MNYRVKAAAVVVASLLCAGLLLRPFEALADGGGAETGGFLDARGWGSCLGSGVTMAVLGGFRTLAADGLWLRTYEAWLARDPVETRALIRLVTIVDDQSIRFWLEGARMLAYDLPRWRVSALQAAGAVSPEMCRQIVEEEAGAALRLLEEARRRHPASAEICIEIANIQLNVRRDLAAAADWYRRAAATPNAPYCAARIHGDLLRRLGRHRDAYFWLRGLYPTLPPGEEAAMREVVLKRMRDLEDYLAIPQGERYSDPPKLNRKADRKDG